MNARQKVLNELAIQRIPHQMVEHIAIFTIDEMEKLEFPAGSTVAKNLFLRDDKGRRHFLLMAAPHQKINLKQLEDKLDSTKLSFASEERLEKYLGLTKGSVSPFGLINDAGGQVEFYIDDSLRTEKALGVHPNDNTATILLSCDDLVRFAKETGHEVNWLHF